MWTTSTRDRQQRDVAVHALDDETRPARCSAGGRRWRRRARRSRSAAAASPRRSRGSGTTARSARRWREPSARRELRRGPAAGERDRAVDARRAAPAGRARSSHSGARSPRRIAVVLAMFASTQLAAATLTVRQCSSAGRPLDGSRMWWSSASPRAPAPDGRARGRETAAAQRDRLRRAPRGRRAWSSVTRIGQPPGGGGPAIAMSPPMLTSTPPAESPRPPPPRRCRRRAPSPSLRSQARLPRARAPSRGRRRARHSASRRRGGSGPARRPGSRRSRGRSPRLAATSRSSGRGRLRSGAQLAARSVSRARTGG